MNRSFLAIFIAFFCITNCRSQKKTDFEGVVKYDISFENSGLPPEALAMLKGAESVTYIKGDKRRVDMTTAMQSTSSYMDAKNKTMVNTMEMGGQKYLIKMSESDMKEEKDNAPLTSIKYIDSTKNIAGYKCKKAEVTLKSKEGKDETVTVFYTADVPSYEMKDVFPGLKGFPLEYSILQGGIKMTFTAKSVSKETVPDSKFEIPKEGYTETTMDELKKSMGEGQ